MVCNDVERLQYQIYELKYIIVRVGNTEPWKYLP